MTKRDNHGSRRDPVGPTALGPGQFLAGGGYAGYSHLKDVQHASCGAHLLRDLRGIAETDPDGQLWAKAVADPLLEAHQVAVTARAQGRGELTDQEVATIDRSTPMSGPGPGPRTRPPTAASWQTMPASWRVIQAIL
jgi:hypothetical protein